MKIIVLAALLSANVFAQSAAPEDYIVVQSCLSQNQNCPSSTEGLKKLHEDMIANYLIAVKKNEAWSSTWDLVVKSRRLYSEKLRTNYEGDGK